MAAREKRKMAKAMTTSRRVRAGRWRAFRATSLMLASFSGSIPGRNGSRDPAQFQGQGTRSRLAKSDFHILAGRAIRQESDGPGPVLAGPGRNIRGGGMSEQHFLGEIAIQHPAWLITVR